MVSLVHEKNSNFQRDNYMLNNMLKKEDLINAGSHYGHPASKWHPNYKQFIVGKKNGIHIIDVESTLSYLESAMKELRNKIETEGFKNVAINLSIADSSTRGGDLGWINENLIVEKRIKRWIRLVRKIKF